MNNYDYSFKNYDIEYGPNKVNKEAIESMSDAFRDAQERGTIISSHGSQGASGSLTVGGDISEPGVLGVWTDKGVHDGSGHWPTTTNPIPLDVPQTYTFTGSLQTLTDIIKELENNGVISLSIKTSDDIAFTMKSRDVTIEYYNGQMVIEGMITREVINILNIIDKNFEVK